MIRWTGLAPWEKEQLENIDWKSVLLLLLYYSQA